MIKPSGALGRLTAALHVRSDIPTATVRSQRFALSELDDTASESDPHTRLMSSVWSHVTKTKTMQLFWPLCLEDDMGKTVLKMFACCHLAKEGRVSLSLNEPLGGGGGGRLSSPEFAKVKTAHGLLISSCNSLPFSRFLKRFPWTSWVSLLFHRESC